MPDDTPDAYLTEAPAPSSMSKPDLRAKRVEAALGALSSLAMLAPIGKLGSGASVLKRALIGGGVGTGMAALADAAGAQETGKPDVFPSPMHELQTRLKKQGLYQGPIDGRSEPGAPTEKAVIRLKQMFGGDDPLHTLRMIQDPKYRASEEAKLTESKRLDIESTKGKLGLAETERKKTLNQAITDAAREGESWGGTAKRWAPYVGGGVLGTIVGGSVGKRATSTARTAAQEAEAFAGKNFAGRAGQAEITPANVDQRLGAVNTFWGKGGGASPFAHTTTSGELSPKSLKFQVQDHPPATSLYKPGKLDNAPVDALALAAAGGDYLASTHYQDKNAGEAEAARGRFKDTQSPQDAVEATHAQGRSNFWGGLSNAALPFASTYLLSRKFMPAKTVQPNMKATSDADAMRSKVQDYLNRQPSGGPQSVLLKATNGAAPAPRLALPAPSNGPSNGVGAHTVQTALQAKGERAANWSKIFTGSSAQTTEKVIGEHLADETNFIKSGVNRGRMSVAQVNALQRKLEEAHAMPISVTRLKQELKARGVTIAERG